MAKERPDPSNSVKSAIVDTSVYVEMFRTGAYSKFLLECRYLIRGSSVVLAELGRGARTAHEIQFVNDLSRRLHLITPGESDWLRSGGLVKEISTRHTLDLHKTREIHFDVLIGLSARRIGAAIITVNHQDFQWIADLVGCDVVLPTE